MGESDYRERGGGAGAPGPYIGIYGWRKRCLYLLILSLLVLVILNLALTLWVLKVMEFNTDGMGNVRIVEGGLEVAGHSYILGNLVASSIRSKQGHPIHIRASHNITLTTEHYSHNTLTIGKYCQKRGNCIGEKREGSSLAAIAFCQKKPLNGKLNGN
ncbi:delta-sarcoglycan-like [Cimex lectularius]|uniref:Gamma-sarcoglycan n=1 Tax=Cimex lectularius TaxID=79782 RepID=A0A8I6SU03_CIMLE|nr:delta-sarcoglycan-like [Cimex lectularius]